jgi:holo-[acyl-carrier protein] synthase
MVIGVGVDLFETARLERELAEGGAAFRESVFTPAEVAYCETKRHPAEHYAARFAAKEALVKALGADGGEGWAWRDAEICSEGAAPRLVLHGVLKSQADARRVGRILLSLSHTRRLALASVILED